MNHMKTAILCGKLFDSQNNQVLTDKVIIVEDKAICDVIDRREFAENPDMEVIDLSNLFVTPGLIDLHVHSGMNGEGNDRMGLLQHTVGELTLYSLKNVQQDLYAGFTTIRDCGSQAFVSVAIRDAIQRRLHRPSHVRLRLFHGLYRRTCRQPLCSWHL